MSETGKNILVRILLAIVFIVSITLIVIGQKNVGPQGLGIMLLGLVGLVFLLWFYNRKYK